MQREDPTLVLASRGDALTLPLLGALRERFGPIQHVDVELTSAQRLTTAAVSVRPSWSRWKETFYKSMVGYALRSGNAQRRIRARVPEAPVVLQVHTLFEVHDMPTVLYVDCTHAQVMREWPAWSPMNARQERTWVRRETQVYQRARHLFTLAEGARRSLIDDYGLAAADVTTVGAGTNYAMESSARRCMPPGPARLLFVGNDFERKGGRTLLAAHALVRQTLPDAQLHLVGERPAVSVGEGVVVHGRLSDRDELRRLYESAAAFVLPSYFDPFPLVMIEAMSLGVPCVGSRQSGAVEMLGSDSEAGLLVDAGDERRLAAALLDLLDDPNRNLGIGLRGRARVRELHTWDAVVDRMSPVLVRLLKESRARADDGGTNRQEEGEG